MNVKGDEGFGDHETSEPRASRTRQTAGVAHTAEQPQVTCSSHSSDDSCGDAECTRNALNEARTCATFGVD